MMWKGLYVELYGEFSSRKLQQPANLLLGVSEIRPIKINIKIKAKQKAGSRASSKLSSLDSQESRAG